MRILTTATTTATDITPSSSSGTAILDRFGTYETAKDVLWMEDEDTAKGNASFYFEYGFGSDVFMKTILVTRTRQVLYGYENT